MSRTLVHLSDLHFGRVDPDTVPALIEHVWAMRPDLVIISGDLTQRARVIEFESARSFLDKLPQPQLVIPGNHDVPLYDLYGRFVQQFGRYQRYIGDDLEPFFTDDEIAVIGVHTARALTWKGGRINQLQMTRVRERLSELGPHHVRVIVTHHPFEIPEGRAEFDLVGRARMAMEHLADCGADLLLSGHLHTAATYGSAVRYGIDGHSALIVHAGTATSTRRRGEVNSFNRIEVERGGAVVEQWHWTATDRRFDRATLERFEKQGGCWQRSVDLR